MVSFKTRSCQTKQLPFLDVITQSLWQRKHGRSHLLGFSKAFDSVPLLRWLKGKPEKMEVSRQIVKGWGTAWREGDKKHWKGAMLEWGGSTKTSLRAFNIFTDSLDIKKTGVLWNMTNVWWNLSTAESWRVLLVLKKLWISQAEILKRWNYTSRVKHCSKNQMEKRWK